VASPESKHTLHFYKYYLLPRCLKDIAENSKLNYHLFQALRKAIFRPSLWFRGILFPFLKGQFHPEFKAGERKPSGTISKGTIKQAQILASVLMKCSVPNVHASAAFLKILELNYTSTVGVLVKLFIDKKFSLPLSVIRRVSEWFLSFGSEGKLKEEVQEKKEDVKMPVLWFQSLLSYGKSYRKYLTEAEIMSLKMLVRKRVKHAVLSKEIIQVFSSKVELETSKKEGEGLQIEEEA
jgi:essential nuclear protein 1